MENLRFRPCLSANALKLFALAVMTIDHIGLLLLPQYRILRIIGRLAYPIFAYMIAEGCRYTAHKARYLGMVLGIGVCYQLFNFFAMHSLHQCILITFSLSIWLIYTIGWAEKKGWLWWAVCIASFLAAVVLCRWGGRLLNDKDFRIDYGLAGVLLPVLVYLADTRPRRLLAAGIGLTLLALDLGGIQWFSLLALVPLALYDGSRGKRRLKYLFYIYYPLHLAALWGIGLLLNGG